MRSADATGLPSFVAATPTLETTTPALPVVVQSPGAQVLVPPTAPAGTAWQPLAKPRSVAPGSTTLLGLRAQNAQEASKVTGPEVPLVDGVAFVDAVLSEIRRIKRDQPHIRPVVVFDLDNTIFETRARTLAALQAYDAAHGTTHFAGLELTDMGKDGRHTAQLLGLSEADAAAVHAHWTDWFWSGPNFMEDKVFTRVERLVREASAAGAEVVYLTGRVNKDATLAQLRKAGLPDANVEHVLCKPAVGANTGAFKGEWLQAQLEDPTVFLGWFLTEGRRDIQTVQAHDARIPCVRLGFVHEREGHAVDPRTPLIPESWTTKLRSL